MRAVFFKDCSQEVLGNADKEWLYPNLRENGYTYSVLENLHYIPHVHGGLECVYVLDGELCATIDEKNYTLKKGDIS